MTDITPDTVTETTAATAEPEAGTTPEAAASEGPAKAKAPARRGTGTKRKAAARGRAKEEAAPSAEAPAARPDASPAPAPGVEMVPLSRLDVSPFNPRRGSEDEEALARLAHNIRAVGLIHDLAGLRGEDGRVGVVAGGRRLRALRLLHEAEPGAYETVPVRLAPDEETARAWAVSENAAREPLHPADEVRQFGALRDRGLGVPQIATAFAATEGHVRRRLALAGLPEVVLDALRAGEINLDHAAAFTVAQDEGRVREALAYLCERGDVSAAQLRGILAPRVPTLADRRAAFVGLPAYEAAGGAVTRDLFSESVYLHDEETLQQVFEERLAAEAERVRAEEGWLWAEAMPEARWIGWHEIEGRGLTPCYPEAGRLTPEEWEEFEALTEAAEEGALDDEVRARLDALEAMGRECFTEAQRAVAGALVHVGLSGRLEVAAGLIRREDREAAMEAGVLSRPARPGAEAGDREAPGYGTGGADGPLSDETRDGGEAGAAGDGAAAEGAAKGKDEPPAPPPHSAALVVDLDAIRTGAVQAALLDHPDLLVDLLAFGFSPASGAHGRALDLHPGRPLNRPGNADGFAGDPRLRDGAGAGEEGDARPLPHLTDAQRAEAFASFRERPREVRTAALAAGLARLMPGRDQAGAGLFDAVAAMAGADVRAVWRPTAAGYFGRVTADRLDAILADLLEAEPGDDRVRMFRAMRKGEKAAVLEALFADPERRALWRVTPAQAERMARWVPEPIRTAGREERPEPGPAPRGEAGAADGPSADGPDGAAPDEEPGGAGPATVH